MRCRCDSPWNAGLMEKDGSLRSWINMRRLRGTREYRYRFLSSITIIETNFTGELKGIKPGFRYNSFCSLDDGQLIFKQIYIYPREKPNFKLFLKKLMFVNILQWSNYYQTVKERPGVSSPWTFPSQLDIFDFMLKFIVWKYLTTSAISSVPTGLVWNLICHKCDDGFPLSRKLQILVTYSLLWPSTWQMATSGSIYFGSQFKGLQSSITTRAWQWLAPWYLEDVAAVYGMMPTRKRQTQLEPSQALTHKPWL
jgi:hypothetical protein